MTDDFFDQREIPFEPSSIETVDMATYKWLKETMNIHTKTNQGWKKTPVVWVSTERARNTKDIKELRDKNGHVILPIITLNRTGIEKNPSNKGIYNAALGRGTDGGSIEISRIVNQEKSSNFASADTKQRVGQLNYNFDNKKKVFRTATIPLPVYIDVTYDIEFKTEYQQQMNEMIQPFITKPGGINYQTITSDGHQFEMFIQSDFSQDDNGSDLGEEERLFHTTLQVKVLGYLIGEGKNQDTPKIVVRENFVEVKIPRERVIVGDIKDLEGRKIF